MSTRTVRALVNPKMLKWARKSARLRTDEAAKKIGVSEDSVRAWESDELKPTINQARTASKVYGRPLAAFYLSDIPKDYAIIKDFRRISDQKIAEEYPYKLIMLIRDMQDRQAWVKDILKELAENRLGFVKSAALSTPPTQLSEEIRKKLKITVDDQLNWKDMNSALNTWIHKVENNRMFVSQTSKQGTIDVSDARGFALVDSFAPFIFLNAKDSLGGRIFTLAHELVHIWLGESGVTGESFFGIANSHEEKIETYCNKVAGLVVFPDNVFSQHFKGINHEKDALNKINSISKKLFISRAVVARRLLDKSIISKSKYQELHNKYIKDWKDNQPGGGGNYYTNQSRAISKSFIRIVVNAYDRGRITGSEASGLVQTKLNNFSKLLSACTETQH